MYSGTLIQDLLAAVEKAEQLVARQASDRLAPGAGDSNRLNRKEKSHPEQFAQSLGLRPADRHLGLFLVIHPELVGALEPGNHFPDPVDIYQVRAVRPPEKIRV